MGFDVTAAAYDRFMGRWSEPLARQVVTRLDPQPGQRALDVGCGPGAMTAVLVEVLGAAQVLAVDPSPPFVAALAERLPGVDVRVASAEQLPLADDSVDLAVAGLAVHFMTDPVRGLSEMKRVTRPGGQVAATVWDHAGGGGPLSLFWDVARGLDPGLEGEAGLVGSRRGQLLDLGRTVGLTDPVEDSITVRLRFATFEDWWHPFTLGVGPAGDYVAGRSPAARETLLRALRTELGAGPLELEASAWFLLGRVLAAGAGESGSFPG